MRSMFGITGIMVKFFTIANEKEVDELNNFLYEYDGNIIDIQFQKNSVPSKHVMVVYRAFDE